MLARHSSLPLPLLFGIATAFGLSSSLQSYLLSAVSGDSIGSMFTHLIVRNRVCWSLPAMLAPLVMPVA